MKYCTTTCNSYWNELNDKNIANVNHVNFSYPTLTIKHNNSNDVFIKRTNEALKRMDNKKSKGISAESFLDELEQW